MKSVDALPKMLSDESNQELEEQKSFTVAKKKSPTKTKSKSRLGKRKGMFVKTENSANNITDLSDIAQC